MNTKQLSNWAIEKKNKFRFILVWFFFSVFSFRCFLGRAANNRPQGQGRSSRAGRQRNLTKPKSVCSLTSKLLQLPHSNSNALTRTTIRDELMPRIIVRFCAAFVNCSSNYSSYTSSLPWPLLQSLALKCRLCVTLIRCFSLVLGLPLLLTLSETWQKLKIMFHL